MKNNMSQTENGYLNPAEFEPQESELKRYQVDFYDSQYFNVVAQRDEKNRVQIIALFLFGHNNKLIHNFDVDYIDELLSAKILTKIYNGYED